MIGLARIILTTTKPLPVFVFGQAVNAQEAQDLLVRPLGRLGLGLLVGRAHKPKRHNDTTRVKRQR